VTLVAVSTVVRRAQRDEHSGYLRLVDLDRRRLVAAAAVPESPLRAVDPNPRGGLRGARGVSATDDRFVLTRGDRIFVLDRSWRLQREISHPWVGGIHDVFADEAGIWVASTAASLLVRLSWGGEVISRWCWAEDPALPGALGFRRPPAFDDSIDYRIPSPGIAVHDRVHLNAVVKTDSRLFVSLGMVRSARVRLWGRAKATVSRAGAALPATRGLVSALRRHRDRSIDKTRELPAPTRRGSSHAIVELELTESGQPGTARLLWHQRDVKTPKHNVWVSGSVLVFNDSDSGELVGVDLDSGEIAFKLSIPGSPPFVRGLHPLSEDELIVGSQRPAAIYPVRLRQRSVDEAIELQGKPWETVYAICGVPERFDTDNFERFREWATDVWVALE
jgi:hypothetical protein